MCSLSFRINFSNVTANDSVQVPVTELLRSKKDQVALNEKVLVKTEECEMAWRYNEAPDREQDSAEKG